VVENSTGGVASLPGGVADNNEEELLEFGSKGGVVFFFYCLLSKKQKTLAWIWLLFRCRLLFNVIITQKLQLIGTSLANNK
jgi:hypothetical protein